MLTMICPHLTSSCPASWILKEASVKLWEWVAQRITQLRFKVCDWALRHSVGILNYPLLSLKFLIYNIQESVLAVSLVRMGTDLCTQSGGGSGSAKVTAQGLTGLTRAQLHERELQVRMSWQHAGWPVASSTHKKNLPGYSRATPGFGKCPNCRLIFINLCDHSMLIPLHGNNNQYAD